MLDRCLLGATASLTVTVTDAMSAAFDDEDVHPVYATAALVRHAEQISRRLLRPHLTDGEEGVGVSLSLRQRAPVPVGSTVELTATVTRVQPRRLHTEVVARHHGRIVARVSFTQAVVDLKAWRRRAGLPGPLEA